MKLQNLLEKIGLNPLESRIYLELVELGATSASQMAKSLNIPRSTARSALDQLSSKNLVNKIFVNRTQIYSPENINNLEKHLKNKIEEEQSNLVELKKHLPILEALWCQRSYVPQVRFFEGIDGIIEAFNFSLHSGAKEILSITSYRFFDNKKMKKNDDNYYIPLRIKKGIKIRILTNNTPGAKESISGAKGKLREHRILTQEFPIPGNIHIHGDYVTLYSGHDGEYSAVIIKSKIFSDTLKTLFEFSWVNALQP